MMTSAHRTPYDVLRAAIVLATSDAGPGELRGTQRLTEPSFVNTFEMVTGYSIHELYPFLHLDGVMLDYDTMLGLLAHINHAEAQDTGTHPELGDPKNYGS